MTGILVLIASVATEIAIERENATEAKEIAVNVIETETEIEETNSVIATEKENVMLKVVNGVLVEV